MRPSFASSRRSLLAFSLAVSISACGGSDDASQGTPTATGGAGGSAAGTAGAAGKGVAGSGAAGSGAAGSGAAGKGGAGQAGAAGGTAGSGNAGQAGQGQAGVGGVGAGGAGGAGQAGGPAGGGQAGQGTAGQTQAGQGGVAGQAGVAGMGQAGKAQAGMAGAGGTQVCQPGSTEGCYSGPAGTEGKGACKSGMRTCKVDGSGFGDCQGEVLPAAESCATPADDNCDGQANEGCACVPGEKAECYSGDDATKNVGHCKAGQKTCKADGSGYGDCTGEVLPAPETCETPYDDDCNGKTNESGTGCACTPGMTAPCYGGPAGTEGVSVCKGGTQTCKDDGSGFGECAGQVLPGTEVCDAQMVDEDCNGQVNEGGANCVCVPGSTKSCYSGPAGTENVGICASGVVTCTPDGLGYTTECVGEVLPSTESCLTAGDEDCNGAANEGCICEPNSMASCYSGPAGTAGVGICQFGEKTCNAAGTAYSDCTGEVLPQAESCATTTDDNCDGQVNEGCLCAPNSTASCYDGPAGTMGVGVCKAGTKTCNAQGTAYGVCSGEVVPSVEDCATAADENCNGQSNEGCVVPVSYATSVQPIFKAKCATCHTTGGSGGANLATSYASTQLASYSCAGKTKGACALDRIQNGSMPQGHGCTGNPTTDAGNSGCLTAAQQATIAAWISGGQLP